MNKLHEPSGFEDDDDDSLANAAPSSATSTLDVYKLRKCGHMLHRSCLTMYIKNSTKVSYIGLLSHNVLPHCDHVIII